MADLGGLVPGAQPCTWPHDHDESVCVLCGVPWCPPILNRCPNPACDGMCTWGPAKGAKPSSWRDYENLIPEPVPAEVLELLHRGETDRISLPEPEDA